MRIIILYKVFPVSRITMVKESEDQQIKDKFIVKCYLIADLSFAGITLLVMVADKNIISHIRILFLSLTFTFHNTFFSGCLISLFVMLFILYRYTFPILKNLCITDSTSQIIRDPVCTTGAPAIVAFDLLFSPRKHGTEHS